MIDPQHVTFPVSESRSEVSGLLLRPADANSLLVLGHGAGAGMNHPFLVALARRLADFGMATLRYQFPYMEEGKRRPDYGAILQATVRSAVAVAYDLAGGLPLLAGGKSMGGRMTSLAAARESLSEVLGLVFVGFPLHPAGRPGTERAEHLKDVGRPMLFLQGTRDRLAGLDLLKPVIRELGRNAHLHPVEGGDHSFNMLESSGRSRDDALDELATATTSWAAKVVEESIGR
ncbi:MAG: alpha/beta hydrolase [Acidobacteria bacterium]|nr:alpha/beta hydrolase [Acidobacteriota bacterium]